MPHGGRMKSTWSWFASRSMARTTSSADERSSYSITSIGRRDPSGSSSPPASFTSFTQSW